MKRTLALAGCALLGSVSAVFAQSIGGIDLQGIERKADHDGADLSGFVDHAIKRAAEQREPARDTADTAINRVKTLDAATLPRGPSGAIDLDELVASARTNMTDTRSSPLLIAFASLSMPADSLKQMIDDVHRAGGVVVFRGLPGNSGKVFAAAMRRVVDQDSAPNVAIDPRLFRAFNVQAVPTYVVTSSDFRPCDGFDCKTDLPAYDVVSGNATVQYVLTRIADDNGPGAAVARVALANLARTS